MQAFSRIVQGNLVVSLCGELDDHSADSTRTVIDRAIEQHNFNALILDLKNMTFMDSTGIGVLIGRYKRVKDKHPVYVTNPSSVVDKIFKMSGLYEIMERI